MYIYVGRVVGSKPVIDTSEGSMDSIFNTGDASKMDTITHVVPYGSYCQPSIPCITSSIIPTDKWGSGVHVKNSARVDVDCLVLVLDTELDNYKYHIILGYIPHPSIPTGNMSQEKIPPGIKFQVGNNSALNMQMGTDGTFEVYGDHMTSSFAFDTKNNSLITNCKTFEKYYANGFERVELKKDALNPLASAEASYVQSFAPIHITKRTSSDFYENQKIETEKTSEEYLTLITAGSTPYVDNAIIRAGQIYDHEYHSKPAGIHELSKMGHLYQIETRQCLSKANNRGDKDTTCVIKIGHQNAATLPNGEIRNAGSIYEMRIKKLDTVNADTYILRYGMLGETALDYTGELYLNQIRSGFPKTFALPNKGYDTCFGIVPSAVTEQQFSESFGSIIDKSFYRKKISYGTTCSYKEKFSSIEGYSRTISGAKSVSDSYTAVEGYKLSVTGQGSLEINAKSLSLKGKEGNFLTWDEKGNITLQGFANSTPNEVIYKLYIDKLLTELGKLVTIFNTHVHGNMGAAVPTPQTTPFTAPVIKNDYTLTKIS